MYSDRTIGSFLSEPDPIRSLWLALNKTVFKDSPRLARVDRLTRSARTFYDTECFFGEVCNGGFSQFFSNSSGDRSRETLVALDEIDAKFSATSLRTALQVFPDAIAPADRQHRCELLFRFDANDSSFLEKLTTEYYRRAVWHSVGPFEDYPGLQVAFLRERSHEPIVE